MDLNHDLTTEKHENYTSTQEKTIELITLTIPPKPHNAHGKALQQLKPYQNQI